MPARTVFSLESLQVLIPKIFDQTQVSTANHQKNYVALYKLHCDAAGVTESVGQHIKLTGERAFEDVLLDMITRILPVKKGASQADRIVKFVAGYTKFINEKTAENVLKKEDGDPDDTTASRFVARLIKFLLKGFIAKDKVVRYRVVHLIAEMISHLGELDEDVYLSLRSSLMDRIHDKEPQIRVQTVISLTKLLGSESPSDMGEDESSVLDVLLETLSSDAAADVRRAAMLNLPISAATLGPILERTRDVDNTIRKLVYSNILQSNTLIEDQLGPAHPRALTISQRELIVRNGLGDRESSVRNSAGALMGSWVDVVLPKHEGANEDIIALLKMFDLTEGSIAEDALLSVFNTRIDIFEALEFGDGFWTELTPEKAFLARVFVEHCINEKHEARLEIVLPVVTSLAFRIQSAYNALLEEIDDAAQDLFLRSDAVNETDEEKARREQKEEARMDSEFVIGEMLKLAVNLDYADEIGRRKMFQLVRDMISQEMLPESLLAKCLDVLRILSPNERDLIRVVVEVVHELRDPDEDMKDDTELNPGETPMTVRTVRAAPKPVTEMSPEEKGRADAMDLRCLSLCIGMLERVNGTFEENSTLEGILGELIIPSVKRKEIALREKGLVSLGLCCLIARRMALNSFQLFLSQVQSAPELLKLRVLQIIFDILMVHESDFLGKGGVANERIIEFLLHVLGSEESEKVSALLCVGVSKLVLSGIISDERILRSLVLSYVSPDTAENQELRQCLSYFLPVYCYSSVINQRRMLSIFLPVFERLSEEYKTLEEDQDMISPAHVGAMFVDWTNPQKAIEVQGQEPDAAIHIDLASDIIKAMFHSGMEKEDKKTLCQILNKLYIPDKIDDDKLRRLKLLMHTFQTRRNLGDTIAKNAFAKFDSAISKKFEKQLEGFSEEEYRQLEYLQDLFEFLDDLIPEDEDDDDTPKRPRKRRSDSIPSVTSDASTAHSSSRGKGKKNRVKRRRLSASDDETDGDQADMDSPAVTSAAPTRTMPKRAASAKKTVPVENDDVDAEDDAEDTPQGRKQTQRKSTRAAEEKRLDAEIDDLLDGETSHDSIMDSGPEEAENSGSEEEVNEIL